LRALVGLSKLGLLIRNLALQGLAFLYSVLELLLDLTDPGLVLFADGLFLRRSLLGLGQRLFKGLHLGRRSYKYHGTMVNTNHLSFLIYRRSWHTLLVLQLLFHTAEFFLGPLQTLLQSRDFGSMGGRSQQRRLLFHIDMYG
jgi:hypothetical protein